MTKLFNLYFLVLSICVGLCLMLQPAESRPLEITIKTSASATATASVYYSDGVRTFSNVATSSVVQNNIFHILLSS